MKIIQKKTYLAPVLAIVRTAPTQMMAVSDPEVHTTSMKASENYDALVKENKSNSVWDDVWNE